MLEDAPHLGIALRIVTDVEGVGELGLRATERVSAPGARVLLLTRVPRTSKVSRVRQLSAARRSRQAWCDVPRRKRTQADPRVADLR